MEEDRRRCLTRASDACGIGTCFELPPDAVVAERRDRAAARRVAGPREAHV